MQEPAVNWTSPRKVSVVTDTPGWYDPFAQALVAAINQSGDTAMFARTHEDIPTGDIAFYLSCMKITPPDVLARNALNLVVHASALPKGRGFSPIVWQVLEGADVIPVSLIEAVEPVDSGQIFARDKIRLEGHELNTELRDRLGRCVNRMCLDFLAQPRLPRGEEQTGEPNWYRRRTPKDSELDVDLTLAEQFNLLRVVDNEAYPAFFIHRGRRYTLSIVDDGPAPKPEDPA